MVSVLSRILLSIIATEMSNRFSTFKSIDNHQIWLSVTIPIDLNPNESNNDETDLVWASIK